MKTLFISDLDGTLLDNSAKISEFTLKSVNDFVENGGFFTIATARSTDSVFGILDGLHLNLPAVFLNGVAIYDFNLKKFLNVEIIEKKGKEILFSTLKKCGITGFVFTFNGQDFEYFYENLDTQHRKDFHDERSKKFGRTYKKVDFYKDLAQKSVAYFSTADTYENLANVYEMLKNNELLNVEFYKDTYNPQFYYLEICAKNASKFNATNYIKNAYNFDKVVCFGDNLNDLSLFRASDEGYAVLNAKDELKKVATNIIGSNIENGVALFINEI